MTSKQHAGLSISILYFSLYFYFLHFSSCGDKVLGIHPRLISWSQEFVADDGPEFDAYHLDAETYFHQHLELEYQLDTIVVSAIINTNACAHLAGDIDIQGDSIILKTRWVSDEGCSSTHFIRATYHILNQDNLEYSFFLK